jgi:hypothetical protein
MAIWKFVSDYRDLKYLRCVGGILSGPKTVEYETYTDIEETKNLECLESIRTRNNLLETSVEITKF